MAEIGDSAEIERADKYESVKSRSHTCILHRGHVKKTKITRTGAVGIVIAKIVQISRIKVRQ